MTAPARRAAYHEAAHAVAALSFGIGVRSITIEPNVETGNRAACALTCKVPPEIAPVVFLAGVFAELLLMGYDGFDEWVKHLHGNAPSGDIERALKDADDFPAACQQAASLVLEHSDQIGNLAEVLLERGTLTGDEVVAAIFGTPPLPNGGGA